MEKVLTRHRLYKHLQTEHANTKLANACFVSCGAVYCRSCCRLMQRLVIQTSFSSESIRNLMHYFCACVYNNPNISYDGHKRSVHHLFLERSILLCLSKALLWLTHLFGVALFAQRIGIWHKCSTSMMPMGSGSWIHNELPFVYHFPSHFTDVAAYALWAWMTLQTL